MRYLLYFKTDRGVLCKIQLVSEIWRKLINRVINIEAQWQNYNARQPKTAGVILVVLFSFLLDTFKCISPALPIPLDSWLLLSYKI